MSTMMMQSKKAAARVRPFLSAGQWAAMSALCQGEEGEFFQQKFIDVAQQIDTMPKNYEQSGEGDQAIVHPELARVSELVLRHHEWPSGAGYPNAIAGHEIPPLARVISVVDWYAACRERRTYRPELVHERAMELTYFAAHEGKIDLLLTELLERMLARESWRPCSSDPERVVHAAP